MSSERGWGADDPRRAQLAAAVGAPSFMIPWLHLFYNEAEVDLVLAAAAAAADLDGDTVARAVRRAVLDANGTVSPSSFHARYEIWALYEYRGALPQEIRDQLNTWELDYYLAEVGPGILAFKEHGRGAHSDQSDYTYLLLDEAEALVKTRPAIYLWPCNCRAMMDNCDKSHTCCLRFENNRGIGWEITAERAVEILRQCDREGLMHTAYTDSQHGHHGICNCCSDCCFPILAGERLGAADVWPVRRHVAVNDAEACTLCNRCVRRCPFGAISLDRKRDPKLLIDPSICRGCGVCSTGCPESAISMETLAERPTP